MTLKTVFVTLGVALCGLIVKAAAPEAVSGSVTLTENSDWSDRTFDTFIAAGATIDLNGYKLSVSAPNNASFSTAFTFTDSTTNAEAPGELHITVASGATFSNKGILLDGNLRIVKDGAGTLGFGREAQPFKGGIEVLAGMIRADANPGKHAMGGNGINDSSSSVITLHSGAQLNPNGQGGWGYSTIVMDGGTIVGKTDQLNAAFVFTAESTINPSTGNIYLKMAQLNLEGQTLRVEIASGKNFGFMKNLVTITNGVLDVVSGGTLYNAESATDARTVDLKLNAALNLAYALSVHDYDAKWTTASNTGNALLNVYGTFTPRTEYFYGCTLQNGAVIDLSAKTSTWSTTSLSQSRNTVDFANNATITIALGARRPARGERLVAWNTAPANLATLSFVAAFDAGSADTPEPLVVMPAGIFYGSDPNVIERAYWTGGGDPNNLADYRNWACTNMLNEGVAEAVPTEDTTIYLGGACAFNVPKGSTLVCRQIAFAGTVELAENCDWGGLDLKLLKDGGTIDVCGHKLLTVFDTTISSKSFSVTNSVVDVLGEFHIEVAKDVTATSPAITFGGNLKVVKEGEGTLLPFNGKSASSNDGGWDIVAGTVKQSYSASYNMFGSKNAVVVVREGATYDLNNQNDLRCYPFVLDGGTLTNTGADRTANLGTMGLITLTTNSSFNVAKSFPVWGTIDLGGYALTIDIAAGKHLYLDSGNGVGVGPLGGCFTNGTVNITGGGYLTLGNVNMRDMRTVDFTIDAALELTKSMSARNLTMVFDSNVKSGTGTLDIYGIFTPSANNYINNFTLKDGATLNLANWDGVYDVNASVTEKPLTLADNATITVDIGERSVKSEDQVVAWTKETRPANTKFKLKWVKPGVLETRDTGLYLMRGTTIILR